MKGVNYVNEDDRTNETQGDLDDSPYRAFSKPYVMENSEHIKGWMMVSSSKYMYLTVTMSFVLQPGKHFSIDQACYTQVTLWMSISLQYCFWTYRMHAPGSWT